MVKDGSRGGPGEDAGWAGVLRRSTSPAKECSRDAFGALTKSTKKRLKAHGMLRAARGIRNFPVLRRMRIPQVPGCAQDVQASETGVHMK